MVAHITIIFPEGAFCNGKLVNLPGCYNIFEERVIGSPQIKVC